MHTISSMRPYGMYCVNCEILAEQGCVDTIWMNTLPWLICLLCLLDRDVDIRSCSITHNCRLFKHTLSKPALAPTATLWADPVNHSTHAQSVKYCIYKPDLHMHTFFEIEYTFVFSLYICRFLLIQWFPLTYCVYRDLQQWCIKEQATIQYNTILQYNIRFFFFTSPCLLSGVISAWSNALYSTWTAQMQLSRQLRLFYE